MTHADRQFDSSLRAAGEMGHAQATVSVAQPDDADVLDRLSDYLDGSLSAADAERVRQHLDRCERCQAFWRTLRQVVTATRGLPAEGLPERTKRRLIDDALSVPTPR